MSKGTAEAIGVSGHRVHHVVAHHPFNVGGFYIHPFDIEHDAAEPLGFVIMHGREKVLFLTDTSYCKYTFTGITVLMIECNFANEILEENYRKGIVDGSRRRRLLESHMSLQRVKDFLEKMPKESLREIHLMHLSDANSNEQLFKSEIQKQTGVPVYICRA